MIANWFPPSHRGRVSAIRGDGMDTLQQTIQAILNELPPRDEDGPTRLPIDRHFTISGFGTVVTGTLLSGRVNVGDMVFMNKASDPLKARLMLAGFKVREVDLSEFLKAGGSAKCLTLKLTEPSMD